MTWYLTGVAAHVLPVICVLLAAFLQSLTGFGLAIAAAPLLMLFYDAKEVVSIVLLLCACGNCVQGFLHLRTANLSMVACLYLGVLIGQPAGLFIYNLASSDALKLAINFMVLFSLVIMRLLHVRCRETRGNSIKAGVLSGITSVTTGMGGPPFLLYVAHTKMAPDVLRATCFVFFFLCNVTSLGAHALGGYAIGAAFMEFLYLLPGLVLGVLLGNLFYDRLPKGWIRQAIFVLLVAASLIGCAEVLLR